MLERDPLSVRYDTTVRQVMMRAARASLRRRGVLVWIASPRGEFRRRDAGGRTSHERAFTRSAYHLVWRTPVNLGQAPDWSLKLTWGEDGDRRESSRGRLARPVTVRLYPRASGQQHVARNRARSWVADEGLRSVVDPATGERTVGG